MSECDKWLSILLYMVQNAGLIIASRQCSLLSDMDIAYVSSTAVMMTEIIKLGISLIFCFWLDANSNVQELQNLLWKTFFRERTELVQLIYPSLLYVLQNNLQYLIESTPIFHVMYQMKIVTTAIFYSFMISSQGSDKSVLGNRITTNEWICISLLAIGVGCIQASHSNFQIMEISFTVGLFSVIGAVIFSGYAGIHLERTIKSSKSSIWLINIQLSVISFFVCAVIHSVCTNYALSFV